MCPAGSWRRGAACIVAASPRCPASRSSRRLALDPAAPRTRPMLLLGHTPRSPMERTASRTLAHLALALALVAAAPPRPTQPSPADETRSRVQAELAKLPPPLAQKAREMLSEKDVRERAKRAGSLASRDPAAVTEFLLAVLAAEPAVDVRISIVESLGDAPTPRLRQALSDLAASDADARVSLSARSEEHTSELQSLRHLVCRLLLEKKKTKPILTDKE